VIVGQPGGLSILQDSGSPAAAGLHAPGARHENRSAPTALVDLHVCRVQPRHRSRHM